MTVRMRALTRSPGAAAPQPQLGGALLARERRERQARAEALQVDVPARVAQLGQRRALGDGRSPQLDDDLGARGEAAYAGAAAKASSAPSATNRARAGSLT